MNSPPASRTAARTAARMAAARTAAALGAVLLTATACKPSPPRTPVAPDTTTAPGEAASFDPRCYELPGAYRGALLATSDGALYFTQAEHEARGGTRFDLYRLDRDSGQASIVMDNVGEHPQVLDNGDVVFLRPAPAPAGASPTAAHGDRPQQLWRAKPGYGDEGLRLLSGEHDVRAFEVDESAGTVTFEAADGRRWKTGLDGSEPTPATDAPNTSEAAVPDGAHAVHSANIEGVFTQPADGGWALYAASRPDTALATVDTPVQAPFGSAVRLADGALLVTVRHATDLCAAVGHAQPFADEHDLCLVPAAQPGAPAPRLPVEPRTTPRRFLGAHDDLEALAERLELDPVEITIGPVTAADGTCHPGVSYTSTRVFEGSEDELAATMRRLHGGVFGIVEDMHAPVRLTFTGNQRHAERRWSPRYELPLTHLGAWGTTTTDRDDYPLVTTPTLSVTGAAGRHRVTLTGELTYQGADPAEVEAVVSIWTAEADGPADVTLREALGTLEPDASRPYRLKSDPLSSAPARTDVAFLVDGRPAPHFDPAARTAALEWIALLDRLYLGHGLRQQPAAADTPAGQSGAVTSNPAFALPAKWSEMNDAERARLAADVWKEVSAYNRKHRRPTEAIALGDEHTVVNGRLRAL